jgi:tetratricopeptide (TPR) repeat protein
MTSSVTAQEVTYPDGFDDPVPMYTKALGPFTRTISTTDDLAQTYFNQGIQMMYAFTKVDAARSFRAAQKADPTCAICHWGEAWAWGSYLNGPMTADEAPRAYAAIQKAKDLKKNGNDVEQALIEAMSVRYVKDYDSATRAVQDSAYAVAMQGVADRFPQDLDAVTLYGEALFLLEARRGARDINDPDVMRLHEVLERVLNQDIRHPGACHLYIHATESTQAPAKAEACSEYIGNSIPGASHINHMPSHTWNVIGRWGDGVRANIQAWHSDQKAAINEGFAIYPSHNLHMLVFAASMDGQAAIAVQAGRDYEKLTGNNLYSALTLVRFGRFDEIDALSARPDHGVFGGMWDFTKGYAALRKGNADFARVYAQRVLTAADSSDASFRGHSAKNLLGTLGNILMGEIHRANGDLDGAVDLFRKAAAAEDELIYDEPEPLPFAARHWLGAALLEKGDFAGAEEAYRAELKEHPHNGWSLYGLLEALEGQNKTDAAVQQDFDQSWARSDTWIRGSRF